MGSGGLGLGYAGCKQHSSRKCTDAPQKRHPKGGGHGKYLRRKILLQYPDVHMPVIKLDTEIGERLPLGARGWWD
jgi:hypothetical protein